MKTKDFIKMLQEADPTGEAFIRLPGGGAPWFAEAKEGYWDGPYQYLEPRDCNDTKGHYSTLVTSVKESKVDIHVKDMETIVWEEKGEMDKIKNRFKFEFNGFHLDSQKEKENKQWIAIEKEALRAKECHNRLLIESTEKTIEKYFSGGYEVRQSLDKKIGMYNCIAAHKNLVKYTLNQEECKAIITSSKFYPEETNEYYIWKYDPEKGQNWSIN